jgi:hypothetical protein
MKLATHLADFNDRFKRQGRLLGVDNGLSLVPTADAREK